jgi:hypothetical protein
VSLQYVRNLPRFTVAGVGKRDETRLEVISFVSVADINTASLTDCVFSKCEFAFKGEYSRADSDQARQVLATRSAHCLCLHCTAINKLTRPPPTSPHIFSTLSPPQHISAPHLTMASDMESDQSPEVTDAKHSLRTASLELSLERSKHAVEMVAKDEDIRKLRVRQCLLENESGDFQELLEEEQGRADDLEAALEEALAQVNEQKAAAEMAQKTMLTQSREAANLKVRAQQTPIAPSLTNSQAELKAMENVTSDSNKILSEKLALNRELSSLRPEVEHLRAQVEFDSGLLAEKLSLQRQLNTAQVELENEKRTASRAMAKQVKKMEQDNELRAEVEELRKELAKEKKDRLKTEASLVKAEKAVEKGQSDLESQQEATERVQTKLDKVSKKEAERASKQDEEHDAELTQLREELAQEKSDRDAELGTVRVELTQLREEIKQEKSARVKAEKASKKGNDRDAELEIVREELTQLREELTQEKNARVKAEKASKKGNDREAEFETLREELENEKRHRLKLEKASKKGTQQNEAQSDDLRKELDEEKRERKQQEKEYTKTLTDLQGRNAVLDHKLNAFREKLRSTKEKLKVKEAELETVDRAQAEVPARATREASVKPTKNTRKRTAASVEPEVEFGTPSNGFPAKKAKRNTSISAAGDTSTFSLTPFLNRTGSVAPGETIIEEAEEEVLDASAAAQEATPTAPPKKAPKKAAAPKPKALAPSASKKANAKPRKKTATTTLAIVSEEDSAISSQSKDNSENAPITIPLKDASADDTNPSTKEKTLKLKSRKSLMSFSAFTDEPTAEKKKRKLGSSAMGKTLFDAEDEDAAAKPASSKGIFAARALGRSVLGKNKAQLGRPISGGHNMLSEEGFSFSPLKKDRRVPGGPK